MEKIMRCVALLYDPKERLKQLFYKPNLQKLCFLYFVLSILCGCNLFIPPEPEKGSIRLSTTSNYWLSDITIRKVDKIENGAPNFSGDNYAGDYSAIYGSVETSHTYEVTPGQYYIFLRYRNTSSFSSGWWQTTTDNLLNIQNGDVWNVRYTYYGGQITKQ